MSENWTISEVFIFKIQNYLLKVKLYFGHLHVVEVCENTI